jgi:hypothetical protein
MEDSRRIVVTGGVANYSFTKQPNDKFILEVDFGKWIGRRGTLSSFTQSLSPAGPTITAQAVDGNVAPILIAAGTTGYTGVLVVKGIFSNTEEKEIEIDLSVLESA